MVTRTRSAAQDHSKIVSFRFVSAPLGVTPSGSLWRTTGNIRAVTVAVPGTWTSTWKGFRLQSLPVNPISVGPGSVSVCSSLFPQGFGLKHLYQASHQMADRARRESPQDKPRWQTRMLHCWRRYSRSSGSSTRFGAAAASSGTPPQVGSSINSWCCSEESNLFLTGSVTTDDACGFSTVRPSDDTMTHLLVNWRI